MNNANHEPILNAPLINAEVLDDVLPQTQCGLCGHADGCLPYAQAMLDGEAANLCVPGGQPVADTLARLLNRESLPVAPSHLPIMADGRPQRLRAVIREAECIGCTKCLLACPVDAIVGSGKLMHSVITDLCTGCELCLPPCPVDCIDLIDWPHIPTPAEQQAEQNDLRKRYQAHQRRLANSAQHGNNAPILAPLPVISTAQVSDNAVATLPLQEATHLIQQATLRSQIKKLERQQTVQFTAERDTLLQQLKRQLLTL